jgi:hypothetical protein
MKVSQLIKSKYLRKEDVDDERVVTIRDVKKEAMPNSNGDESCVIYFKEEPKGMVAGNPVLRVLQKNYGNDTDTWIGRRVVLYVDDTVMFGSQVVGALRLRPIKKSGMVEPPKAAGETEPAPPFDDAIPFEIGQ